MSATLLKAVTTTGTDFSTNEWRIRRILRMHTVQVTTTGAPTAVTIALEGSLDGDNYFPLATYEFTAEDITNQSAMFHVVDKPVGYVRFDLTILTGGTSPTVTAKYEAYEDSGR